MVSETEVSPFSFEDFPHEVQQRLAALRAQRRSDYGGRGLEDYVLHCHRHEFARWLLDHGVLSEGLPRPAYPRPTEPSWAPPMNPRPS